MANNRNELTYGFFQKIPNILLFILGQSDLEIMWNDVLDKKETI